MTFSLHLSQVYYYLFIFYFKLPHNYLFLFSPNYFLVANNLTEINNRSSSSAWSSSATSTPPPLPPLKAFGGELKLQKNDLSKNSNIDFANFANVFQNSTNADPFLDQSNNNIKNNNISEGTMTRTLGNRGQSTDLFADFNDNFGSSTNIKQVGNVKSAFDPFGVSTTLDNSSSSGSKRNGSSHQFSAFDDDDPFGDSLPQKTIDATNGNANSFAAPPKKINTEKKSDRPVVAGAAVTDAKYSEDYSKNFDTDLEEVLKRSLFDQ